MEQLSFFTEAGQSKGLPTELLEYHAGFIDQQTSDQLLDHFITTTPWKQTTQKLWDKEYLTPRLTAWYGDPGTDYSVSGKISNPNSWTPELLQPYIDVVLASFGPRRIMYGSDWPVMLLAGDYARWYGTVTNAVAKLSKAEQDRIMGGTAAEAYGI